MRIVRKEKQIKEVDVILKDYTVCDRCGNKIETTLYECFDFDFEIRIGEKYPEGGHGNLLEMDLCQNCVPELKQLLLDNGYRINESEWDI